MHVCVVHACTRMYVHVFVHMCVCVCVCMHVCVVHACTRMYVHVFVHMCVCVCVICYVTQLVKGHFLLSISVSKTVCPAFCPERCSELDGVPFCCNTKCAAGCAGGVTESHCVVSVNGGGSEGQDGGGRVNGWRWRWEGIQRWC